MFNSKLLVYQRVIGADVDGLDEFGWFTNHELGFMGKWIPEPVVLRPPKENMKVISEWFSSHPFPWLNKNIFVQCSCHLWLEHPSPPAVFLVATRILGFGDAGGDHNGRYIGGTTHHPKLDDFRIETHGFMVLGYLRYFRKPRYFHGQKICPKVPWT